MNIVQQQSLLRMRIASLKDLECFNQEARCVAAGANLPYSFAFSQFRTFCRQVVTCPPTEHVKRVWPLVNRFYAEFDTASGIAHLYRTLDAGDAEEEPEEQGTSLTCSDGATITLTRDEFARDGLRRIGCTFPNARKRRAPGT